ncbi:MAG TPA: hypothetical protein VKZ56_06355 [Membranihabitans sp.]|nr:hypothetical protein [Membranihabitans sp.]
MRRLVNYLHPWVMAGGLLLLFLVIYFVHFLLVRISGEDMDYLQIWIYMMAAALVYAIFSTIQILYATNTGKAYTRTILAFLSLVGTGVILASVLSGKSILELDTYRRVFIFVVFTFLVLISMVTFMKQLETLSRREDEKFLNKKD